MAIVITANLVNGTKIVASTATSSPITANVTVNSVAITASVTTGGIGQQGIPGDPGEPGLNGVDGVDGLGVPEGGTTGQALTKNSGTNNDTEWSTIDKSYIGLGNVDNTTDASKPISTATQTALDAKSATSHNHVLSAGATDVTSSSSELNILDGATLTTTELNYVDGVTSSIQTQLNSKASTSHTHLEADITDLGAYLESVDIADINATGTPGGTNYLRGDGTWSTPAGGAVDSVNSQTGVVVLDQDDIGDGTTYKQYSATEKTKLSNITVTQAVDLDTMESDIALKAPIASPSFTGTVNSAGSLVVGGAFGTPVAVTVPSLTMLTNTNLSTGLEFRNDSTGTSADSRFAVADTTGNYIAFSMPSTGNTQSNLFGLSRPSAGFIFGNGGTTRHLAIGTIPSKDLILGTNNTARITITGAGVITSASDINVPDEAYDATAWNGSLEVPTKNAVRDKIESMSAGSGITRSIVVTSGNVTAGSSASIDYVYIISGAHTVTLPTCVSNTNRYTLKNAHSVAVSLAFTSGETADGGGITLAPNDSVDLISNNTEWKIA